MNFKEFEQLRNENQAIHLTHEEKIQLGKLLEKYEKILHHFSEIEMPFDHKLVYIRKARQVEEVLSGLRGMSLIIGYPEDKEIIIKHANNKINPQTSF